MACLHTTLNGLKIFRISWPIFKATDLSVEVSNAFVVLKKLVKASLGSICEDLPPVECDKSNHAIAASLSHGGRPVVFMPRTFSKSEWHYPSIKKEATAIV